MAVGMAIGHVLGYALAVGLIALFVAGLFGKWGPLFRVWRLRAGRSTTAAG